MGLVLGVIIASLLIALLVLSIAEKWMVLRELYDLRLPVHGAALPRVYER